MGTGTMRSACCEALRDLDLLLVLDNFEQVTPAAAFVAELLAVGPRVSILVTSRQPLHLRGEHEIAVPPLGSDDAVALFLARARAVRPGFGLDDDDRAAGRVHLCRARSASPRHRARGGADQGALAGRVARPAGPPARPAHPRSQRSAGPAALDARHDLVELRRLAARRADPVPPAVGVLRADGTSTRRRRSAETAGTSVIEAMETLLDHHLVRRDDTSAETRFSMFETVREFGRDQLANDDDDARVPTPRRVLPGVRPHRRARARRRASGGVARPHR